MIQAGRITDTHEGPLVVFIIGLRINYFLKPGKWLPVLRAMGPMMAELSSDPDSGFIGAEILRKGCGPCAWCNTGAISSGSKPMPATVIAPIGLRGARSTMQSATTEPWGIFHETYCVPAGGFETVQVNMPPFGLARFTGGQPATGSRNAARERMRETAVK